MVKTYQEWKEAVVKEHDKLHGVLDYLTPYGKERMLVYGMLLNLDCYCSSAKELLEWIDTQEGLEKEDLKLLVSPHASQPISALRRVVKLEEEAAQAPAEPEKPTYYVTYRIDARFVAEVRADSVEEAKQEAQYAWEGADFGVASDINGEPVMVEDADGNYLWEK